MDEHVVECYEHRVSTGNVQHGYIPMHKVQEYIQKSESLAEGYMKMEQPDHLIYAAKEYDKDGKTFALHLYVGGILLNDEEFQKRTAKLTNYMIYALHKN